MFELTKNLGAAKKDFVELLKILDLEKEKKSQLLEFSASFKIRHQAYKRAFETKIKFAKPKGDKEVLSQKAIKTLTSVIHNIELYNEDKDPKELGKGLGKMMATIQYALTSAYFESIKYEKEIIEIVEGIIAEIHKLNKDIRFMELGNRVSLIVSHLKKKENGKTTAAYNIALRSMLNNIAAELTVAII